MARAYAHSEKARRAPAAKAAPHRAGPAARINLLEFLLGSMDIEGCARESLRWLGRELAVKRSLVLVFDESKKRLVHLAEHGVDARDFAISLVEEEGHPLLIALSHREPTFFPATARQPATPLGRKPFHAIVLRSARIHGPAAGVLLVEVSNPELSADVAWFGAVFGEQMARLQSRVFPGEAGLEESALELRHAKEELVTERHRLDLIIDSVADPIVVTNASGEVLLMNTPAERLFTVPKGKGLSAQRLVRSNDVNFSSFVSNLFFTQAALQHRGDMVLLDPVTGDALPFEAVAGKVITEQGELTAIVTTLHDRREAIERARLYAQVEQAKNELEGKVQAATGELAQQNELLRRQAIELEQASNLKSQFLANMSHELRTPLNAILGYTHMLLNKVYGIPSPPQQKSLQRVDSNARHLMSIINEILDIARIESGKMPVHLDDVKLDSLVKEVLQELDPIVVRSKLIVTSHVARVPTLRTDRQKVKQILVNLLSNALKFTHKGSVTIHVSLDARTSTVRVAVADSGIGIAEAYFRKIFEDFRQVDNSPTREYGGTGLGLAICRRFAQMLGGRITVESKIGAGSAFTLHLPTTPPK